MMRALVLAMALGCVAAAPQRGLSLQVPSDPVPTLPVPPVPPAPRTGFQPAPLPNREVDGPTGPRASNAPNVSPTLLNRTDQYRGEGFSRGSTAQTEQDKRVKPGAGFNFRMPFAPE